MKYRNESNRENEIIDLNYISKLICSLLLTIFLISFRWPLVEQALLNPEILQSDDLIEAILSYNRSDRWNFDGLKCFLDECIEDEEKSAFYTTILPKVFRNYKLLEMLIFMKI